MTFDITKAYLNFSLVITVSPEKHFSMYTIAVVKILNATPNPSTTRYPIAWDRGGEPPKKLVSPW